MCEHVSELWPLTIQSVAFLSLKMLAKGRRVHCLFSLKQTWRRVGAEH